MRTYISILVLLLLLYGCTSSVDKTIYFAEATNQKPQISVTELNYEPFDLEHVESSYIGLLEVYDDKIMFIDKKFCYVFLFDRDGHYIKRYLGQGPGPKELATGVIDGFAKIEDGFLFLGGGNDCHLYNDQFEYQDKYIIDKGSKNSKEGYDAPWIYTMTYENMQMKSYKQYLYYTVYSEYDDMNFIDSPEEYFAKSCYLAKMNLESGKVEKMLGKYPSVYDTQKTLKQASFVNFDITSSGHFMVSFEGDSLIYEYDMDFKPVKTYGYAGREMRMPERYLSTFYLFKKYYRSSREESGYYTGIDYINETQTLFRTYKRGKSSASDGLQIYREGMLIGDVDVPKGFKMLGYIAPYYYATCGIDEENERIELFKFVI